MKTFPKHQQAPAPLTRNILFWEVAEKGKRWHVKDYRGTLVGFVRYSYDGWDGYVLTGKKWPESEKWVYSPLPRTFWNARRIVEWELEKITK